MIRINLLPVKAAQKKEMLKGQLIVLSLVVFVSVCLCGAAYMQIITKVQDAQEEIDQKRFEISKLMKAIGEVNQFKKRQEELRAKLDVLDKLKAARTGPVILLDELYKALPSKLWITKFVEGNGKASVSGIGGDEETVAIFMRNLQTSDYFDAVELKVTKEKVTSGLKFQQFDLTCNVKSQSPDIPAGTTKKKDRRRGGT